MHQPEANPAVERFGPWLRRTRLERGLTQAALAHLAGCAPDVLRQFEAGAKRPSERLAARIADALALTPELRPAFIGAARRRGEPPLRQPPPPPAAEPLPFPATKIRPPLPSADVLPRPRLELALRAALGARRLVLVSAPAGAGKTTLLSRTLLSGGGPGGPPAVGWVALDPDDNDLGRFLRLLVEACAAFAPASDRFARPLLDDWPPDADEPALARRVAGALVNGLLAAMPPLSALVLDDLHTLTDAAAHAALDYLVSQLPPGLTLVLASRHDPPLALARWRARRELVELRLEELAFRQDEAAGLLNGRRGLGLTPEQLDSLHRQTGGWAVGLGMLGDALARGAPTGGWPAADTAGGRRHLYAYLAAEVLERQEEGLRAFILASAILPELTPSLCAAVAGRPDAARLLEELLARNLFLVELERRPAAEPAYRFHDLFRAFLLERLHGLGEHSAARLHLRAAAAEREPTRRLHHLLSAGAHRPAAELIAAEGERLEGQGRLLALEGWIGRLPAEVRERHPWLLHWRGAAACQRADLEAGRGLFRRALAGFEAAGDLHGIGATLVALTVNDGLLTPPDELAPVLDRAQDLPLTPYNRARLLAGVALRYVWHGPWEQAGPLLDAALDLAEADPEPRTAFAVADHLTAAALALPGATARLTRLARLLGRFSGNPRASMLRQLARFQLALLSGAWPEARATTAGLLAEAASLGLGNWFSPWVRAMAARISRGPGRAEQGELEHDVAAFLEQPSTLLVPGLYAEAVLRLERGELPGARALGLAIRRLPPEAGRVTAPFAALFGARLAIAERRAADAARDLAAFLAEPRWRPHLALLDDGRLLLAAALLAQGQEESALLALEPALAEAARHGAHGLVALAGPLAADPLRLAARRGLHVAVAQEALRVMGMAPAPDAQAPERKPPAPLSPRELEVLRLLSQGATGGQIAERLVISPHTAKRHIANILGKLGAQTRAGAISRAYDLGLL